MQFVKQKPSRRTVAIIALILLLIGVGAVWWLTKKNNNSAITEQSQATEENEASDDQPIAKTDPRQSSEAKKTKNKQPSVDLGGKATTKVQSSSSSNSTIPARSSGPNRSSSPSAKPPTSTKTPSALATPVKPAAPTSPTNPTPKPKPIIFSDSFETDGSPIWRWETARLPYSLGISTQFAQVGTKSLRVELRKDDPDVHGSKRSELTLRIPELENPLGSNIYNIGIMLPNGGTDDYLTDPISPEIIVQWHNWPDPGEAWTNPPLSLHTENGRYILRRVWDDAPMSTSESIRAKGFTAQHDLGSYMADKGRFVNWRFEIKWGWLNEHNPKIVVYKDGVNVLTISGPNTTNDQIGNYFKIGVYKWDWKNNNRSVIDRRVIYYDNIVVW